MRGRSKTLRAIFIVITAVRWLSAEATEVILQDHKTSGDENGPQLTFIAEDSNPDTVIIAFAANADADIDTSTFRVRYGLLGLDVTEEFLEHGNLDNRRVAVARNLLEPGKYRVTVELGDTRARRTVMKMRLLVRSNNG